MHSLVVYCTVLPWYQLVVISLKRLVLSCLVLETSCLVWSGLVWSGLALPCKCLLLSGLRLLLSGLCHVFRFVVSSLSIQHLCS
jgi:hypothetical protein